MHAKLPCLYVFKQLKVDTIYSQKSKLLLNNEQFATNSVCSIFYELIQKHDFGMPLLCRAICRELLREILLMLHFLTEKKLVNFLPGPDFSYLEQSLKDN